MIIKKMFKIIKLILFFSILINSSSFSSEPTFDVWLKNFKKQAMETGISENVVNDVMSEAKFLPKVIEYDRYQPEFYEDTFTYIRKRSSRKKVFEGLKLYNKEKKLI